MEKWTMDSTDSAATKAVFIEQKIIDEDLQSCIDKLLGSKAAMPRRSSAAKTAQRKRQMSTPVTRRSSVGGWS
jgi:hypothetical protein